MKSLYPKQSTTLKFYALLVTFFIASSTYAQDDAYAKHTKTNFTSSVTKAEPVIRVKARSDRKILLNWSPFSGAVSHYVLERSTDGRSYSEAGLLFTGEWEEEREYYYTDKFRSPYLGPLYYRLRVVGLEGSVYYTPVTILNASNE
jgi:hypothetical protein